MNQTTLRKPRAKKQTPAYRALIAEQALNQKIEDAPLFQVIRNNQFVQVSWNDLTEAEHRHAYNNTFYSCDWEG